MREVFSGETVSAKAVELNKNKDSITSDSIFFFMIKTLYH